MKPETGGPPRPRGRVFVACRELDGTARERAARASAAAGRGAREPSGRPTPERCGSRGTRSTQRPTKKSGCSYNAQRPSRIRHPSDSLSAVRRSRGRPRRTPRSPARAPGPRARAHPTRHRIAAGATELTTEPTQRAHRTARAARLSTWLALGLPWLCGPPPHKHYDYTQDKTAMHGQHRARSGA